MPCVAAAERTPLQACMQTVADLAVHTRNMDAPPLPSARSLPSPRTTAFDSSGLQPASLGTQSTASGSLPFHTMRERPGAGELSPPGSANVYATIASQLSGAAMSTLSAAQPADVSD